MLTHYIIHKIRIKIYKNTKYVLNCHGDTLRNNRSRVKGNEFRLNNSMYKISIYTLII